MLTALDSETSLIYPGCLAPRLVCVTAFDGGKTGRTPVCTIAHHSDPDLFSFLVERFSGHTTFANAPYDLAVFMRWDPRMIEVIFDALDDGRVHCIQMREKLIDIGRGWFRFEEDDDGEIRVKSYSLNAIAQRRRLGKKQFDQWRMRYHDLIDVPLEDWPNEAKIYALTDAKLTYDIHVEQEGGFNLHDEPSQVRAHMALHLTSCHGIRTDAKKLDKLEGLVDSQLVGVSEQLMKVGLVREDGTRDTKAAVRRMLEKVGEEATITGAGIEKIARENLKPKEFFEQAMKEGQWISVNAESTSMSGDETLMTYSRYTQLRNLKTGSIKHLRQGVLLPLQSYFQPLMATGRTSSSRPNIQNLRRLSCKNCKGLGSVRDDDSLVAKECSVCLGVPGIRECFVPREGHVFVAADFAKAEMHTLAQTCLDLFGESKLADALNDGIDPHDWVGSVILGCSHEEFVERYKAEDEDAVDARQLAKVVNFGCPGGVSAKRLVDIARGMFKMEISDHMAQRIKGMWFQAWPEMARYFEYVGNECVDNEGWHWAKTTRSNRLRSRTTFTAACNNGFQAPCADGAKAALYEVTRLQRLKHLGSVLYGTRVVNFIHDENVVECREEIGHAVAIELERVMPIAFNMFVPDVPTTADATIMYYWSKRAKRIFDENGRLVPWPRAA